MGLPSLASLGHRGSGPGRRVHGPLRRKQDEGWSTPRSGHVGDDERGSSTVSDRTRGRARGGCRRRTASGRDPCGRGRCRRPFQGAPPSGVQGPEGLRERGRDVGVRGSRGDADPARDGEGPTPRVDDRKKVGDGRESETNTPQQRRVGARPEELCSGIHTEVVVAPDRLRVYSPGMCLSESSDCLRTILVG